MASEGGESDIQMSVQRKRKFNFPPVETAILVEKYEEHKLLLDSKLTNQVTNIKKAKVWQEITTAINSVGTATHTTQTRFGRSGKGSKRPPRRLVLLK